MPSVTIGVVVFAGTVLECREFAASYLVLTVPENRIEAAIQKMQENEREVTEALVRAENFEFSPQWMRDRMRVKGVTNRQVARACQVSMVSVGNWKRGKVHPDREHLRQLHLFLS